jgi:hypothetical protein
MTQAQCDGSAEALLVMSGADVALPEISLTETGWCRIEDMIMPIDLRTRIRLAGLEWRGSDVARFIEDGLPPRALQVRGEGLAIVPETGDPVMDYMLDVQMSVDNTAFGFNARWDGVQDTLHIDEASIIFNGTNRITATALFERVDLTDAATIQRSLGSAGLRDLTITSDFDGWFEVNVAGVLAPMLLKAGEVSPQEQVQALKRQAIDAIALVPQESMPLPAQEALGAFISSLPYPRGTARLQLRADPALSAARVVPMAMMAQSATVSEVLDAALDGLTILFTWSPAKETQ